MPRTLITLLLCLLTLFIPACKTSETVQRQVLYLTCQNGEQLLVYSIDPTTGQLKVMQSVDLPGQPGPIALTDDGQHLYAALRNPSRIVPLSRDTATGQVKLLEPTPVPEFPTYLHIDAPVIMHSGNGTFAIRKGKWKLIAGSGSGGRGAPRSKPFDRPYQLYDLESDPSETTSLIEERADVARTMEQLLLLMLGPDAP